MTIGALNPELSAARTLSRSQAVILTAALVALGVLLATIPEGLVVWLLAWSCGVSLVAATYHLVIAAVGVFRPAAPISSAPLEDSQLPAYTILAPLREEGAVVADLVRAFEALDYPQHLLEVKLIVEVDDRETLDALETIELRPHFELLLLPRGRPRTKPRACNFGLAHTRGELVVVYDAEDLPEPQQLRKAAAALVAAPPQVACLQANLHVWNADRNWLAHYGASEFAHLCQVFRAGLERMDAPILLCGTSIHLRTAVLRELSGWDEFNVAEDADLGIRLARAGYRTRMLDSNTYEEANTKLWNWIRQRSRWIKGWVQTWLVHNRHPWRLWRDLGARRAAQLQLTLGLPVAQAFLRASQLEPPRAVGARALRDPHVHPRVVAHGRLDRVRVDGCGRDRDSRDRASSWRQRLRHQIRVGGPIVRPAQDDCSGESDQPADLAAASLGEDRSRA